MTGASLPQIMAAGHQIWQHSVRLKEVRLITIRALIIIQEPGVIKAKDQLTTADLVSVPIITIIKRPTTPATAALIQMPKEQIPADPMARERWLHHPACLVHQVLT